MENQKKCREKTAIVIMACALLAYIILNFTSCIKTTGNTRADAVIEEMSSRYPQDNILEEILEQQIKNQTGIDFDLSPSTPEE